jgi:hypothetical protein
LKQDEESQEETQEKEEILEKNEKKGKMEGISGWIAWNLILLFDELWLKFK